MLQQAQDLETLPNLWQLVLKYTAQSFVAANFDKFLLFARLHRTPIRVDPLLDGRIRFAVSVDVSRNRDVRNGSSGCRNGLIAQWANRNLNGNG